MFKLVTGERPSEQMANAEVKKVEGKQCQPCSRCSAGGTRTWTGRGAGAGRTPGLSLSKAQLLQRSTQVQVPALRFSAGQLVQHIYQSVHRGLPYDTSQHPGEMTARASRDLQAVLKEMVDVRGYG